MNPKLKWVKLSIWDDYVSIQHDGLTRLEVLRLILSAARAVMFRWDDFKPYRVDISTGSSNSLKFTKGAR